MANQPAFLDDPPPTQEDLDRMFGSPASKGELIVPDQAQGRGVGTELLITDVITARRVEVARDEAKILQKLASIAAYAGDEVLLYRWPVKNRRTGKTDTVEGPTVKCAYAIQRCYGNSRTDIASLDVGRSWIFKAVFTDFEAGVQTARLFQQHKGVAKIGGDDDARRLDMSFQIGQSKAIRNAIVAHLELPFVNYMMDEAKKNLVGRIGKNVEHYRSRIAARLAEIGVELNRVERQVGRPLGEWLAPDLARVITEIKAVVDGMALASESWPVEAPPEPKRSDAQDLNETAASPPAAAAAAAPTPAEATPPASESEPPPKNWRVPDDIVGQDAVLKALRNLLGMVETKEELNEWKRQNEDRIAKVTGVKRASLDNDIRVKSESLP
jgi:hypothetical protein